MDFHLKIFIQDAKIKEKLLWLLNQNMIKYLEDMQIYHGKIQIIFGSKDKQNLSFLVLLKIQSINAKIKNMNYQQINFSLLNLDMILQLVIIVTIIVKALVILDQDIKYLMA